MGLWMPEAGGLAFLGTSSFTGPINGASKGTISLEEVLQYVSKNRSFPALFRNRRSRLLQWYTCLFDQCGLAEKWFHSVCRIGSTNFAIGNRPSIKRITTEITKTFADLIGERYL